MRDAVRSGGQVRVNRPCRDHGSNDQLYGTRRHTMGARTRRATQP